MFEFQLREYKSIFTFKTTISYFFISCIRIWNCTLEFAKILSNCYSNIALIVVFCVSYGLVSVLVFRLIMLSTGLSAPVILTKGSIWSCLILVSAADSSKGVQLTVTQ
ncbi:hypothetical protein E2542_SST00401 [Spatholobus suberectus]|nr:hypothetical protein E2542_SST00401 [Spatholobus suberectus]